MLQLPQITEETTQAVPSASQSHLDLTVDGGTTIQSVQTRMNQSCFANRFTTHLPPKILAVNLLRPRVEDIQLHGIFLPTKDVLTRLDEQYTDDPNDAQRDPCRWAIICALSGISALHKTPNGSLSAMSVIAWAFFNNALAVFAELTFREPEISSCEALLAMTLFMLRTANVRVAAQLIAQAACTVLMLGLHKEENYVGLDAGEAERRKRVFWAVSVINADITFNYDLSSPLGGEDIVKSFPEDKQDLGEGSGDRTCNLGSLRHGDYFQHRASLAVMQLRIHKLLREVHCKQVSNRGTADLLSAATQTYTELETWRTTLSTKLPSVSQPHEKALLSMPVAMLQYKWFSCMSKVSMAAAVLKELATGCSYPREVSPLPSNDTFLSSRMARVKCAIAARGTLDVLFRLHPQPFTHLWYAAQGVVK